MPLSHDPDASASPALIPAAPIDAASTANPLATLVANRLAASRLRRVVQRMDAHRSGKRRPSASGWSRLP